MKKLKFLSIFLSFCLMAALLAVPASALEDPGIDSRVAVVLDRKTGEVFYEQNADLRIYPASTTKIMTVLLAVEAIESGSVSAYDDVTATQNMTYDLIADGSNAGILVGETMPLINLLYCAMLPSANEACNVIAEFICGSIPAFIERMNARAVELGCENTHFTNTHGLPDINHYTTASDFCKIALEASEHDLFMQIADTVTIELPATNVSGVRTLGNSNALINVNSMYGSGYYYEDAHGIKTGHTNDAGYCLISTASRDGIELLAAVFGGEPYALEDNTLGYTNFSDSIKLYDWVFNNFSYQGVLDPNVSIASVTVSLGRDTDYVNLRPAGTVTLLLPNDFDINDFEFDKQVYSLQRGEIVTAPVTSGEVLGEVSVIRNGQNMGTVKLVAASSVELSRAQYIRSHIEETIHSNTFRWVFWSIVFVLVLYLAWVVLYRIRRIRYKQALKAANSGGSHVKRRQLPAQQVDPEMEFFSEDGTVYAAEEPDVTETVSAPVPVPPQKTAPVTQDTVVVSAQAQQPVQPAQPVQTPDAAQRSKIDRDYFEEFFKQK